MTSPYLRFNFILYLLLLTKLWTSWLSFRTSNMPTLSYLRDIMLNFFFLSQASYFSFFRPQAKSHFLITEI